MCCLTVDEVSSVGVPECCSFVVLPMGYYMGTVVAVKAMLTVQQRAAGSRMQPKQYGESQPKGPESNLLSAVTARGTYCRWVQCQAVHPYPSLPYSLRHACPHVAFWQPCESCLTFGCCICRGVSCEAVQGLASQLS